MTITGPVDISSPVATEIYFVYAPIVERMSAAQRRSFIESRHHRMALPLRLSAFYGGFYWIVPVCRNVVRWDLGRSRQVIRGQRLVVGCT